MQNLFVFIESNKNGWLTPLKAGNLYLNRFCIDEEAAFELSDVNYLKSSVDGIIGKGVFINSHASKKFTPHNSSWFCRTKGFDFAKVTRDWVMSEH